MKTSKVVTDDAKIFKIKDKEVNYYLMDYQRETVSSSRSGNLYNLVIQMSTVKEEHSRSYKKIFALASEVGGYLKAFVLFYYIYKPFLERKYYIELINHLYNVEGGDNLKETEEELDQTEEDGEGNLITWRNFEFFKLKEEEKEMKKRRRMRKRRRKK